MSISTSGNISPYVASYIRERSHPSSLGNQVSIRLKNIKAIIKCVGLSKINMQQLLTMYIRRYPFQSFRFSTNKINIRSCL